MKLRHSLLSTAFLVLATAAQAAPTTNVFFGNVSAQGSGSCSAITGSFPLQATYSTNSAGANTYYLNILIQVANGSGGTTQQYLMDVLSPNGSYTAYDPNLFGTFNTIPGTYTGPILASSSSLILGNANGPVTLTSGSCVITLAVIAMGSPN